MAAQVSGAPMRDQFRYGLFICFLGEQNGPGHLTKWYTALKKSGIKRRIRPYDLRHAFATEAIAAGVDVGTVAQLIGARLKMLLEHYQHVADKQKRAAVGALPDIPMTMSL
jgi:integrase